MSFFTCGMREQPCTCKTRDRKATYCWTRRSYIFENQSHYHPRLYLVNGREMWPEEYPSLCRNVLLFVALLYGDWPFITWICCELSEFTAIWLILPFTSFYWSTCSCCTSHIVILVLPICLYENDLSMLHSVRVCLIFRAKLTKCLAFLENRVQSLKFVREDVKIYYRSVFVGEYI